MSEVPDIDSLDPTERLVLSALAAFDRRDETPVRPPELRRLCRACAIRDDSHVVGTVSEADVMRTLNRLEATDAVRAIEPESTSPVGKGRPAYDLAEDAGAVADRTGEELPAIEVPDGFW